MFWDVFCRVIDNHGDLGVCWRLACDLASRGEQVRLWVDEPSALAWMAPQLRWQADAQTGLHAGTGQPGVQVCHWRDAEKSMAHAPAIVAGDVVIEAFGCDPPDAFIERMQRRAAQEQAPAWVNLEYLSAEAYVERSHGLESPVWSGPGKGLVKRFFYPGFTPATGGLLREPGLIAARTAETQAVEARRARLAGVGVSFDEGDTVVFVFCYDGAPVSALLDRLHQEAVLSPGRTVHVLLTPGPATRAGVRWPDAGTADTAEGAPESGTAHPVQTAAASIQRGLRHGMRGGLAVHSLPYLAQEDFDRLLWCSDLNFVRGEDSAVRALWAGRPHVWQIYEQDDGVHARKLSAFMDRWMSAWPEPLAAEVRAWWLGWNRLAPLPTTLPRWREADAPWRAASLHARGELLGQSDLTTQLLKFVASSG